MFNFIKNNLLKLGFILFAVSTTVVVQRKHSGESQENKAAGPVINSHDRLLDIGNSILSEVINHPSMLSTYPSEILRADRITGKPALSPIKNENSLNRLRKTMIGERQCGKEKFVRKHAAAYPNLSKQELALIQTLAGNIMEGINNLHASYIAKLNKGGRCEEMLRTAALHFLKFSHDPKQCIHVQKRSAAYPKDGKMKEHGYLLISAKLINPKKYLSDFNKEEQKRILILDPFRDVIISVEELRKNPEKYPHYLNADNLDAVPRNLVPTFRPLPIITCPSSKELKKINKGHQDFFKIESEKVLRVFKQMQRDEDAILPEEYGCDDKEAYQKILKR